MVNVHGQIFFLLISSQQQKDNENNRGGGRRINLKKKKWPPLTQLLSLGSHIDFEFPIIEFNFCVVKAIKKKRANDFRFCD